MSEFTYFGEKFAYADEFPAFEYAEFQEALADDVDATDGRATGVALRLAIACVAESDRARFRKVSRANRAKVDSWLVVYRDWTADAAERPTRQPTDSSDGPTRTPETSDSEPAAAATPMGVVIETSPGDDGQMAEVRSIAPPTGQPGPRGDLALAASRSRPA